MVEQNRRRAFADVATLDAWHEGFEGRKKVSLHIDVVFGAARVGGGSDDAVRFRLALNQAEVVVIVPDTEPAKIDKASVERDEGPAVEVRSTDKRSARRSTGGKVKLAAGGGGKGLKAGGAIEAAKEIAMSHDQGSTLDKSAAIAATIKGRPMTRAEWAEAAPLPPSA